MQWETKGQFSGQVKPVGIEKSMGWKLGFVHFDYDTASGAWMVRLYFKVNPHKVCQQMKIGQSDNLDVKCGRLMIENKKGDGIHIKLSSSDVTPARLLVSKIKNSISTTVTSNKAEVGLPSRTKLFSHKGSENVSPGSGEHSFDLSLFQASAEMSPRQNPVRWPHRNTEPTHDQEHSTSPKRKLELFSPERLDGHGREKDLSLSQRFTGNLHGGNGTSVQHALGPRSFYGIQKPSSTISVHRSSQINSSSFHQSPALKRPKLSSLSMAVDSSRMSHPRDGEPNTASAPAQTSSTSPSRDSSQHVPNVPRHRIKDGETVGFHNLGNTCFLNATLQCLSALEPLSLDIHSAVAEYGKHLKPKTITRKLYLLMKDVRRYDVCPARIKELLIKLRLDMNAKFAPNTQQDVHEVLLELLNRVDEEVKLAMRRHASTQAAGTNALGAHRLGHSETEESSATSLHNLKPTPPESNFGWSSRKHYYFHECHTEVVSTQTEQEMTLMLSLDSSTKTLQDCIHKYFESNDVEVQCEKCGKKERATITRKIVRRPRVFVLNLMRYHTDTDEATKRADLVHVPSYISLYKYCADDAIRPAHIDPVFLVDRLRPSIHSAFMSVLNSSEGDHQINKPGRPVAAVGHYHGNQPDLMSETSQLVSGLADLVSCHLRYVDTYLEDSHERGDDVSGLYSDAHKVILRLENNVATALHCQRLLPEVQDADSFDSKEMLLSEILLKKAVMLDERQLDCLPEDALHLVIEDLLVTRYDDTASNQKSMHSLIDDLGLCVAALESGIMTCSSQEQMTAIDRFNVIFQKYVNKSSLPGTDRGSPDGGSDLDVENETSDGSYVRVEDDIYFKRTGPLEVKAVDNSSVVKADQGSDMLHPVDMKFVAALSVDVWNYAWDEDNKHGQSLSDISLQASCPVSPDFSSHMLQGKHISSFTESDLQNIDCASLTEDEMMVYAQALSRFTYAMEQAPVVDSPDHPPDGAETIHQNSPSDLDCLLKMPSCSDGAESEPQLPESSGRSPVESDQSQMWTPTSAGHMSVDSESLHKSDMEADEECSMLCHEALGDSEESQGNPYDSDCKRSSQISTEQSSITQSKEDPADQPLTGSDGVSGTHCVSCGNVCSTVCTVCGALDQTDFSSQPLDATFSTLAAETLTSDSSRETPDSSVVPSEKTSGTSDDHTLGQRCVAGITSTDSPLHGTMGKLVTETNSICDTAGKLVTETNSICDTAGKLVTETNSICGTSGKLVRQTISICGTAGKLVTETNSMCGTSGKLVTETKSMCGTSGKLVTETKSRCGTSGKLVTETKSRCGTSGKLVTETNSSMHGTAGKSVIAAASDHRLQGSGGLKEFPFSPPKTNNLIKTRDYARLKSPASSPKKRAAKGPSPKSDSVSKRLHYSEKGSQLQQCGLDGNSPDLHNNSMEVNVDDMSFFESQHSSMDAAAWSWSHQSTPPSTSSTLSARPNDPGQQTPVDCDKPTITFASKPSPSAAWANTPVLEGLEPPQVSQLSDIQIDAVDTSAPSRNRKVAASEGLQNIQPEAAVTPKRKVVQSSATYIPDIEEKENVHQQTGTGGLLHGLKDGRQDVSYKLVSVIDHTGSSQFTGHYTAYAFNMSRRKWFHLNDTETRTLTEDAVQEHNAQTGYLFFYMDKDLFDEYNKRQPTAAADRS